MNDVQMNSNLEPAQPLRQSPSHASLTRPKCWLIGNSSELPTAAARVARLRGLDVEIGIPDGAAMRTPSAARNHLIAINFDRLAWLDPGMRALLREYAESGATVYVRGALQPGRTVHAPHLHQARVAGDGQLGLGG